MRGGPGTWIAAGAAVAALVPTAATAGESSGQAASSSLPRGTVARVTSRLITDRRFDHWFAVAYKSEHRRAPAPGSALERRLRRETVQFLIQAIWVQLEARRQRIGASRRAVRREFGRQKRRAFRSEAAYRRFLRRTGQSTRDVLYRIRLDVLQRRIQRRVTARTRTRSARRRALRRFVRQFRRRWKRRTSCAPAYRVRECSRVVPVAASSE